MRQMMVLALLCSVVASPVMAKPAARLGVLVVFDQMPSWLLDRQVTDDGFGGLRAAHIDVDYPYAGTETAPGHATIATGAVPAVHGIAANSWAVDGQLTYVVDDPAAPVLLHPKAGKGPRWLMAPTLADSMKRNSDGRAKVLTISHKDRAAILTAGRSADLAVWYEPDLGRYTSSRAYVEVLPSWLLELGARLPAQAMATGTWTPLKTLQSRGGVANDDRAGEGAFPGVGKTFPHHLSDLPAEARAKAYRMSPQSMSDLFVLARAGVAAMNLGGDDEPDLLVVSVSTTDYIGHNFGGDSLEQSDMMARADVELRSFVKYLEMRVGRERVVVAVTSDHGAPQLPQAGKPWDQVVTYESVSKAAEDAAQRVAPSKTPRVATFWPPQLALNTTDLDATKQRNVLAAVEAAVERVPGVSQVYRLDAADEDSFVPLMRNMAYPGRSAQLFVRQAPRAVFLEEKGAAAGTDHGSVYTYDRRVPFLLQAPGVRVGRLPIQADVRDVVSTMAWAMGVDAPDAAQGHVLTDMFGR